MKKDLRHAPIALFDSGAGGISVLREVKKLLPREQLLYFGDTANAPYGERSDSEVRQLVLDAAARLIPHCKALVLACNTATAVAAAELRRRHPDTPVIGMEPALHPALKAGGHPVVAVLATAATLRSEKFKNLCKRYEKTAFFHPIQAPGIVRLVEAGQADSPYMDIYLKELLLSLPKRPDALVLGCTHFPFAKAALERVFGDIPCFDGATGTAKELCRRLQQQDLLAPDTAAGGILLTASVATSLPLFSKLLYQP